jgi:hypothetical protein
VIGIFAKGVFGRRENEKREIKIRKTINWRERVLFFKKNLISQSITINILIFIKITKPDYKFVL